MQDPSRGRPRRKAVLASADDLAEQADITADELEEAGRGYVEQERAADLDAAARGGDDGEEEEGDAGGEATREKRERDQRRLGRVVDVVLSDMSAPWEQTSGFWKRSVSDPYSRMMNTSGMPFRDHAGSMVRLIALHWQHKTV